LQHVILGAGPLGTAVADALTVDGEEAVLVGIMGNPAYDMPGTNPRAVDGTSADQVSEACAGADVIYLCLNAHYVDWYELFPPRLDAAIEAAAKIGATLVYHDSVLVYGKTSGALTEDLPSAAKTRKGTLRAEMAKTFMEAVQSGKIRGAIGRSSDMYGPGALNSSFNSTLGQRHFYPLLAGKPVSIVGDIDAPHTYGFVEDFARGLVTLGRRDEALGDVWHLPAAPTLTHRQLMELAFDIAHMPPKVRGSKISGYFVRAIGRFQRDVGEVAEILYIFERPFVVSHAKYQSMFGVDVTSHEVALERTLDWYQANPLS